MENNPDFALYWVFFSCKVQVSFQQEKNHNGLKTLSLQTILYCAPRVRAMESHQNL